MGLQKTKEIFAYKPLQKYEKNFHSDKHQQFPKQYE